MFAWQFCRALDVSEHHGWTRFISMQNHYNLLYREEEREMMPLCQTEKTGVIPWSPLARGRLTRPWEQQKMGTERAGQDNFGNILYGKTEAADKVIVDRVTDLAKKRGVPQAQIALAWMLQKSFITSPIIGATKPHHLEDAVAALALKLTPEEIKSLEEPYIPHPIAGHS
jgi:aryl-alcohol dehydrogenase-like predicted oxidoreductase